MHGLLRWAWALRDFGVPSGEKLLNPYMSRLLAGFAVHVLAFIRLSRPRLGGSRHVSSATPSRTRRNSCAFYSTVCKSRRAVSLPFLRLQCLLYLGGAQRGWSYPGPTTRRWRLHLAWRGCPTHRRPPGYPRFEQNAPTQKNISQIWPLPIQSRLARGSKPGSEEAALPQRGPGYCKTPAQAAGQVL